MCQSLTWHISWQVLNQEEPRVAYLPKRRGNSRSLAHTTQWMGLSGVLRMVHTGYDLGAALGWHSKHSVLPFRCTVTCAAS